MNLWYFYFKLMAEMFKLEHIWWINKNFKSLTEPKFLLEIVTQNKPCTKYYKDRITRIFNYFNRVCDSIEVPDDVIAMCMAVHKETINAVSLCSCTRAVLPDLVKKLVVDKMLVILFPACLYFIAYYLSFLYQLKWYFVHFTHKHLAILIGK